MNGRSAEPSTTADTTSAVHPDSDRPTCGSRNRRWTSTFCFPDSVFDPGDFGTATHFDLLRPADIYDARPLTDLIEADEDGVLNDYIEAHVHGQIRLDRHVEAIVLDPSFLGASIEDEANRLGVPVEWHAGRCLPVSQLQQHPHFRGPESSRPVAASRCTEHWMPELSAHHDMREDPEDLQRVWHHVARFGTPLV